MGGKQLGFVPSCSNPMKKRAEGVLKYEFWLFSYLGQLSRGCSSAAQGLAFSNTKPRPSESDREPPTSKTRAYLKHTRQTVF